MAKEKSEFRKLPAAQRASEIAKNLNEEMIRSIFTDGDAKKRGGMNISAFFEQEDPTTDHADKSTDAFGRVCRELGVVPVSMPEYNMRATTLEELADNKKTRMLIGEIISRAWRKVVYGYGRMSPQQRAAVLSTDMPVGSLMNPFAYSQPRPPLLTPAIPVSELVAMTTGIPGTTYRPFYVEDLNSAEVRPRVQESAEIPRVKIKQSQKTIILHKYGRMIEATYEALRYMPIDTLSYFVQRVAILVETEKVNEIIDILVSGDSGGSGTPDNYNATDLDPAATAYTLTLRAWLAYKMKFKNPYMLTHVLGQDGTILNAMLLTTGTANVPLINGGAWYGAQQVTPINNALADGVRAGWTDEAPSHTFIGFDKRVSIERVFEIGGQVQEVDSWIENQTKGLTMTEVEAFAIIEKQGVKTLTLEA